MTADSTRFHYNTCVDCGVLFAARRAHRRRCADCEHTYLREYNRAFQARKRAR